MKGDGRARRVSVLVAALTSFALLAVLMASPAAAQSVTLTATSLPGGGSVSASGSSFQAGDSVLVVWENKTTLAVATVDASGRFEIAFRIPANVTPGAYTLSFIPYTPPTLPRCDAASNSFTINVKPGGPTPTPVPAGTPASSLPQCVAQVVTPTATSTSTATATATATTPTSTVTATATTPTSTVTTTVTTTTTATSTVTATRTTTATATATMTPTKTVTAAPTATKVKPPSTGSGGLLDDGDNGSLAASLVVGAAMLATGVVAAGFTLVRRRSS